MPDAKDVGQRLRTLRGNLSRRKVAELCGISVSALTMYENGERMPRDEVKVKLAELYGKSVGAIFFAK
jgi:transcriptional regulator with XRE-family HTH domain